MDAQVAHDALDLVVGEITVAAVQLQRLVGHLERRVGDETLGHGAILGRVRRLGVELARGLVQQRARGGEFGLPVGQRELGVLEIGDALANCLRSFT